MYGYSHGGCITYRAVEQGAAVTAFSVIEGFTDLRLTSLTGLSAGWSPEFAAPVIACKTLQRFSPRVSSGFYCATPTA